MLKDAWLVAVHSGKGTRTGGLDPIPCPSLCFCVFSRNRTVPVTEKSNDPGRVVETHKGEDRAAPPGGVDNMTVQGRQTPGCNKVMVERTEGLMDYGLVQVGFGFILVHYATLCNTIGQRRERMQYEALS